MEPGARCKERASWVQVYPDPRGDSTVLRRDDRSPSARVLLPCGIRTARLIDMTAEFRSVCIIAPISRWLVIVPSRPPVAGYPGEVMTASYPCLLIDRNMALCMLAVNVTAMVACRADAPTTATRDRGRIEAVEEWIARINNKSRDAAHGGCFH